VRLLPLRLLFPIVVLGACLQGAGRSPQDGAATARAAVDAFMSSARSQDLQAMASVWGNSRGSARGQMPERDLEMRTMSLMCFFNHESYRVLSETQGESQRAIVVEMRKGPMQAQVNFTTVRGPADRWYVQDAPVGGLTQFCANQPPPSRPPGTR
jgi:hypothetical protein